MGVTPSKPTAALVLLICSAATARATEFSPVMSGAQPAPQVVLERYAGIVEGRHPGEFWQIVCTLPCASDVADGSSYRLRAPELGLAPLRLPAATLPERVLVRAPHRRLYAPVILGGFALGAGILGVAGSMAWSAYTNNPRTAAVDVVLFALSLTGIATGVALVSDGPKDVGDIQLD